MEKVIRPNPREASSSVGKRSATKWEMARAAFDEAIEIPAFGNRFENDTDPYGTPAVTYQRTDKSNNDCAVWIKVYSKNSEMDLKPWAKYEADILELDAVKKEHFYISPVLTTKSVSTPFYNFNNPGKSGYREITTESKGPSVSYWRRWPLWTVSSKPVSLEHLFLPAGNYLRFAKAALTALNALHNCGGLVHCDLHSGNWCMSPESYKLIGNDNNDRIYLKINWDKLAIIDLGFSLHPAVTPPLPIPIHQTKASPHLNAASEKARKDGESAFNESSDAWSRWLTFNAAMLDSAFWQSHAPRVLQNAYENVDWREDYWKLGRLLWQLRGGEAVSKYLAAENKSNSNNSHTDAPIVNQSVSNEPRAVNLLVGACETKTGLGSGLAEDLIAWGTRQTDYDLDFGLPVEKADREAEVLRRQTRAALTQRRQAAEALRRQTHAALMQRLDEAIASLHPEDTVSEVFLYRKDIDRPYASTKAGEAAFQQTTQRAEEQRIERESELQAAQKKALFEAEQARQLKLAAEGKAARLADEARLHQLAQVQHLAAQAQQRQLEWEKVQEKKAQEKALFEAEQSRQFKLAAEGKAARLADEARLRKEEAQRQRRERNARWLAKARARATATAADVAPKAMASAVVMGAIFAWLHWGEPVWRDQAKPALLTWYDGAAARGRAAWHVAITPLTSTDPANSTLPAAAPAPADRTAARTAVDAAKNAATKTAQTTPVTAAMAAADAAATSQQRAAAYATTTAQIVASPWWLKGRSQGIAANAEQIAWASATVQHAQKDQWMLAQYALGALHCSAAQPNLARHSSADCGRWLGVALANPAYGLDPVASQKLRVVVTTLFDDMVIGMANGKFHKHAPDYAFARALLPGLQARQADTPSLALRAAYAMACAAKPAQRTQAMQTLQGVAQQRAAAPAETAQASRWLSEWQAGDYSVCAPA